MVLVLTALPEIKIADEIKLLGVIFCDVLNFDCHVDFVLKVSIVCGRVSSRSSRIKSWS
jgi:hypothetical protein